MVEWHPHVAQKSFGSYTYYFQNVCLDNELQIPFLALMYIKFYIAALSDPPSLLFKTLLLLKIGTAWNRTIIAEIMFHTIRSHVGWDERWLKYEKNEYLMQPFFFNNAI